MEMKATSFTIADRSGYDMVCHYYQIPVAEVLQMQRRTVCIKPLLFVNNAMEMHIVDV